MRLPAHLALLAKCAAAFSFDDFSSYDESLWRYDDHRYRNVFYPIYHLKSSARVGARLSRKQGKGLQMLMYPCPEPEENCNGAPMVSPHLTGTQETSYGDYFAMLRAPHRFPGSSSDADPDVYGYFTAGFMRKGQVWNEVTFGFHPNNSNGGRIVSCEVHADTGKYMESHKDIGVNLRDGFHLYGVKLRPCDVSWWVDGKCIHWRRACLTHNMTTRMILRVNSNKTMGKHKMELKWFKFRPWSGTGLRLPPNITLQQEAILWHQTWGSLTHLEQQQDSPRAAGREL